MRIYLNEAPTDFQSYTSLYAVLENAGMHHKKGIAVAVNNEVINKASWKTYELKDADKVTLITATQGG